MNKRKKLIPDVVRGGVAIPLGRNYYYMSGRKHEKGGIDIGKNPRTGIEVEDGEVMHLTKDNVKVFSSLPFLNGKSPAERVMGGESPTKVFNAQESYKDKNGINDDGTKKKAEWGMEEGSTSDVVTDILPVIGTAKKIIRLVRNPSQKHPVVGGNFGGGNTSGGGASGSFYGPINKPSLKQQNDTIPLPIVKFNIEEQTFNDAFKNARKNGDKNFMFNGKLYNTQLGNNPKNYEAGQKRKEMKITPSLKGIIPAELKYGGNKGLYSITTNGETRLRKLPFTGDRPKAFLGTIKKWWEGDKYEDVIDKTYIIGANGNKLVDAKDAPQEIKDGFNNNNQSSRDQNQLMGKDRKAKEIRKKLPRDENPYYQMIDKARKAEGDRVKAQKKKDAEEHRKKLARDKAEKEKAKKRQRELSITSVGAYKKYYDEYSKLNFADRSGLSTFAGVYNADDYALYKVNGRDWKKVKRTRDRKIELERRKNNANSKTNNNSNATSVNATNNKPNTNAKIENKTNNKVENKVENNIGAANTKENKESKADTNKVDNSKNSVSTNSSKENNKTVSTKANTTPTKANTTPTKDVSSTSTSSSSGYKPKVANTNPTKVTKTNPTKVTKTNINKGVTWENATPEQLKKMTSKQKEKIYKQIPKEGTSISSNKSFNVPRITAHLPEMEHEIVDIPKTKFNYTTEKYEDNPEYSTSNRRKVISKVKDKDYFKNGLGDLDEALKNNIEREKQRRASNKSDWKKYWENNKENIVLDGASLASNIVGSIGSFFANKHAINKAVAPVAPSAPIAKRAAKLKTKVNINPQLAQLAKTASDYERNVDNNTASSQVALSRKQPARNNVLTQAINLYGHKENKETELINRDRLNQQSVANSNVDAYNSYLDKKMQYENAKIAFENNRIAKRADNIVGLVNNLNAGVQDIVGKNLQRRNEKNTISAMMFANPNLPAEMVHSLGLIDDETLKAYRKAYKLKDNKQV